MFPGQKLVSDRALLLAALMEFRIGVEGVGFRKPDSCFQDLLRPGSRFQSP